MTRTPARQGGAAMHPGVGVFGGAFNPPHRTHVRVARRALERLPIRELLVVPSGDHPHKGARDMAPASHRLAMCHLAFDSVAGVRIDDREIRRAGPSFTVDTLAELAAETQAPLWLVIGSDNLPLLPTWRDAERIVSLCSIAVYPRAGHRATSAVVDQLPLPPAVRERLLAHVFDVPADAVAASDVRARWRAGQHDPGDLDPAVRDYIEAHGLYR